MLISIGMFALAFVEFGNDENAPGMLSLAVAFGMLGASNIVDVDKKIDVDSLVGGRMRWSITLVGSALQKVSFILFFIWMWLILKA
jgi:hypothetical protein